MSFFKDFARPLRTAYLIVQDRIIRTLGRNSRNLVRDHLPGHDPVSASEKFAVYVHFDVNGIVHDYVVHQLRELVDCGFRITFVTNSPAFPVTSRDLIAPYCRNLLWRYNVGYDFGAYKDGLATVESVERSAAVILMNDSIYGPFWRLSETISKFDTSRADFWGIVDSWEHRYHLQSFFIFFSSRALRNAAFSNFWRNLPYINHKAWVVRNAEVELSQALARNGLRSAALASYWNIVQTLRNRLPAAPPIDSSADCSRSILLTGRASNPMHFFWDTIIREFQCPFIKRELVRSNPAKIASAQLWKKVVSSVSEYDTTLVTRHIDSEAASSTRTA